MDLLLSALKAAAEPTRLRIISLLGEGELTVTELTQILGQSQPRVSRHLKLLGEAELVERLPEGSWAFFRLASIGPASVVARRLLDMIPFADARLALDRERLRAVTRARAELAEAYFRKNAAEWDQIRSLYIDESEVEKALLRALAIDRINVMLDIGTGTGRILELLGRLGVRGIGIDQSREMLAVARAKLSDAGLGHCRVQHGDMYQLPWPAGTFDAVTIHQVLHFADRPAAVIAEAARVLKPGGRLVVADFAPHDLDFLRRDHAHRRLGFSDAEVASWAQSAGLRMDTPAHLPGERLTVTIWPAVRAEAVDPRIGHVGNVAIAEGRA